ncbi:MY15B protein, partial [Polypterus senegalus]
MAPDKSKKEKSRSAKGGKRKDEKASSSKVDKKGQPAVKSKLRATTPQSAGRSTECEEDSSREETKTKAKPIQGMARSPTSKGENQQRKAARKPSIKGSAKVSNRKDDKKIASNNKKREDAGQLKDKLGSSKQKRRLSQVPDGKRFLSSPSESGSEANPIKSHQLKSNDKAQGTRSTQKSEKGNATRSNLNKGMSNKKNMTDSGDEQSDEDVTEESSGEDGDLARGDAKEKGRETEHSDSESVESNTGEEESEGNQDQAISRNNEGNGAHSEGTEETSSSGDEEEEEEEQDRASNGTKKDLLKSPEIKKTKSVTSESEDEGSDCESGSDKVQERQSDNKLSSRKSEAAMKLKSKILAGVKVKPRTERMTKMSDEVSLSASTPKAKSKMNVTKLAKFASKTGSATEKAVNAREKRQQHDFLANQTRIVMTLKTKQKMAKAKLKSNANSEQPDGMGTVAGNASYEEDDSSEPDESLKREAREENKIRSNQNLDLIIGKMKSAGHQTRTKAEKMTKEDLSERSSGNGKSEYRKKVTRLQRVTAWFHRRIPKTLNLRARLAAVGEAISFSGWIAKKLEKRKKQQMRRRMAIRLASTAGMVKKKTNEQPKNPDLKKKTNRWAKDVKNKMRGATAMLAKDSIKLLEHQEDGESFDSPADKQNAAASLQLNSDSLSEPEEKRSSVDAKYAIVLPRVHRMVKSRGTSSESHSPRVSPKPPSGMRVNGRSEVREKTKSPSLKKNTKTFESSVRRSSSSSAGQGVKSGDDRLLYTGMSSQSSGFFPFVNSRNKQSRNRVETGKSRTNLEDRARGRWLSSDDRESGTMFRDNLLESPYYETEEDREVAQFLDGQMYENNMEVHWAQSRSLHCDPVGWLKSETLLPHPTVEKLSKWTMYKEADWPQHKHQGSGGRWETEDTVEGDLELDLTRRQTYIGNLLLSVNPFKKLGVYSDEIREIYHGKMLSLNPPHIFAIADTVYCQSQTSDQQMCIIISGQSGSGKTEAAKMIIQYMSKIYQEQDGIHQPTEIFSILESFGNAKTILNDNSSRFGKYLHIHILNGVLVGSSLSQYLLEKSRVVFQARGERNFHIFYEMLTGLKEQQKQKLHLQEAETYFYLNQCMSSEAATIFSDTEARIVGSLLQISVETLKKVITYRVTETSYDKIYCPLSVESAIDARDAITKALYSVLFNWLIDRINEWLAPKVMDSTVGIVDIYGFEDLEVNSFEQLCINYANEQLQQFVNKALIAQEQVVSHMFENVQEGYRLQRKLESREKGCRQSASTVAARFQQSLSELLARLQKCKTLFVRCLKPNPKKLPGIFDADYVNLQLRHSGILETIYIRKEGYPIRIPFKSFIKRYSAFLGKEYLHLPDTEKCSTILQTFAGPAPELYQLGVSKEAIQEAQEICYSVLGYYVDNKVNYQKKVFSGQHHEFKSRVIEVAPPNVKDRSCVSLPSDINNHSFSKYVNTHLQESWKQPTDAVLQRPITNLDAEDSQAALDICKLILRFICDYEIQDWKELILLKYIIQRGLYRPPLRNEIFCQLAHQTLDRQSDERCLRAWLLFASCLGSFMPSPNLEKPLLKYVSDKGFGDYKAICQHKILNGLQQGPEAARDYPSTQMEWMANQRKGKMVLNVQTYADETFSVEVDSWTTGESLAACIINFSGLAEAQRGWTVSMFTGEEWTDLVGCDYVLDLIGKNEALNLMSGSKKDYLFDSDNGMSVSDFQGSLIPPAPNIQAPSLPFPKNYSPEATPLYSVHKGMPGMAQMPSYPTMPLMGGMMPVMPNMPVMSPMGTIPSMMMPAANPVVPALSPQEVAAQQQAFINQQAAILAQQMTLQALTLSQQQQQNQIENKAPPVAPKPNISPKTPPSHQEPSSGPASMQNSVPKTIPPRTPSIQEVHVKKLNPPSKIQLPKGDNPVTDVGSHLNYTEETQANDEAAGNATRQKTEEEKEEIVNKKGDQSPDAHTPFRSTSPVDNNKGEPTREIRDIIKQYQSRPAPDLQPYKPVRIPAKVFIKKNDPKEEALAILSIQGPAMPPEKVMSMPPTMPKVEEKKHKPVRLPNPVVPPPPPPPLKSAGRGPRSISSSMQQKQRSLADLFNQTPVAHPSSIRKQPSVANPPAPLPPAPPKSSPQPLFPPPPSKTAAVENCAPVDDCNIKTQLHKLSSSVYFSYNNKPSRLFLRKEVMRDTYSDACFRITREERRKMRDLLVLFLSNTLSYVAQFHVGTSMKTVPDESIKRRIVLAARDNWANYFTRLFADILSVELCDKCTLEFTFKSDQLQVDSTQAWKIKEMVELFLSELRKDSDHVIALKSFVTDDKSLLSFRKGDIIRMLHINGLQPGWHFGSIGGRSGLFPSGLTQPTAPPDYYGMHLDRREELRRSRRSEYIKEQEREPEQTKDVGEDTAFKNPDESVTETSVFSMTEFAMKYFREVATKLGWKGMSAEGHSSAEMVQHSKVPIQESLILYLDGELNELAAQNFMRQIVRPIRPDEYLMDFIVDDSAVTLWFQRVIWKEPLHFDNDLYLEVHYRQVLSDYLEGKLLLNTSDSYEQEAAILAALQHCANGSNSEPSTQEIKKYIPPSLIGSINIQHVLSSVRKQLSSMRSLSFTDAKIHFLTKVSSLPLFGCNVFRVHKVSPQKIDVPCLVAVNQVNLFVVDGQTQEALLRIPLQNVLSIRSEKAKKGDKLHEVKVTYGTPSAPELIVFSVKQAKELCHVIALIMENAVSTSSSLSGSEMGMPPSRESRAPTVSSARNVPRGLPYMKPMPSPTAHNLPGAQESAAMFSMY